MKELSWINWVKVICMVFVYFFHVREYTHADDLGLVNFYGAFFTNAFFFASGYLLFAKQVGTSVINESASLFVKAGGAGYKALIGVLNKLILPTILFTTVNYFPKKVLRGEGIDFMSFAHDTVLGGSTWFTSALAVAELVLILLLTTRINKMWFYGLVFSALAISAIILAQNNVTIWDSPVLPWYYKGGMVCSLILIGGGYFWRYESYFAKISTGKRGVLAYTLLLLIAYLMQPYAKQNIQRASLNIEGVFLIVSSVLLVVALCKMMPKINLIDYLGRRSLGLYFLSGAIPNIFAVLIAKLGIDMTFAMYVFISLLSFIMACIIASLMYRYIPFVFDFSKLKSKKHGSN